VEVVLAKEAYLPAVVRWREPLPRDLSRQPTEIEMSKKMFEILPIVDFTATLHPAGVGLLIINHLPGISPPEATPEKREKVVSCWNLTPSEALCDAWQEGTFEQSVKHACRLIRTSVLKVRLLLPNVRWNWTGETLQPKCWAAASNHHPLSIYGLSNQIGQFCAVVLFCRPRMRRLPTFIKTSNFFWVAHFGILR
jgi:hypothetical protein